MTAEQGPGGDLTEAERAALADVVFPLNYADPDLESVVDVVARIKADGYAAHRADPAVPESAEEWAGTHYILTADETGDVTQREATWRDAPTTWGEAFKHFAAAAGVGAAEDEEHAP